MCSYDLTLLYELLLWKALSMKQSFRCTSSQRLLPGATSSAPVWRRLNLTNPQRQARFTSSIIACRCIISLLLLRFILCSCISVRSIWCCWCTHINIHLLSSLQLLDDGFQPAVTTEVNTTHSTHIPDGLAQLEARGSASMQAYIVCNTWRLQRCPDSWQLSW